MIFIQIFKNIGINLWISILFPTLGKFLWSVQTCIVILVGATHKKGESSIGCFDNFLFNNLNNFFFPLLLPRIYLEILQSEAVDSFQPRDVLRIPVESNCHTVHNYVSTNDIPSRFLYGCNSHDRNNSCHVYCRFCIYAAIWESNHHNHHKINIQTSKIN